MPRHDWPTVQELAVRLRMNANHLRRHAAAMAASGRAVKSRSAAGQTCWRVDPDALARRVGRPLKSARKPPAASAKPAHVGPAVRRVARGKPAGRHAAGTVPIVITIHVPAELLRRLFGSGSKGV